MKIKQLVMAPEDDDLFGGGGAPETDVQADVQPELELDDDTEPTAPVIDTSAITDAIAQGFERLQPQAPTKPQMTREELAERMGVWDPSDDDANELSNLLTDPERSSADKKKAIVMLRDRIVNQALKTAEIQFQSKLDELRNVVAPVLPMVVEQRRKQAEDAFYSEFPKLKPFKEVVAMTAKDLGSKIQQGLIRVDPKLSEREFLARETFRVIKQVRPDITDDLIKKQPKGSAPNPAATTTTGKGGSGGGKPGSAPSKVSAIWD